LKTRISAVAFGTLWEGIGAGAVLVAAVLRR
jgi:hypothetical protein